MKQLILFTLVLGLISCKVEDPISPGLLVPRTVEEDNTLPSLTLNQTRLHVETFGLPTDPIIVMIHGGPGGDYRSLLKAKAFADDSYFVIFYDQRGTGLSQRLDRSFYENSTIQFYLDDLDALITHFRTDLTQQVFLIGHSWGAMLATGYINQFPQKITGAILAEPGGFTWTQTEEYLSRSNKLKFFSEALNDAVFPDQIFAGREEHEILDYKAAYFATFENAPGNAIGNAGSYPFWRSGAVAFDEAIKFAEREGFDFTTDLSGFNTKVLFAYSELNTAYQLEWAEIVSAPYPNVAFTSIANSGHELLYFGWTDFYPKALTYLKEF